MNWERIADANGFARWRVSTGHLASQILANKEGLIVSIEGKMWKAETDDELEQGLAKTFGRVDAATYLAARSALRDAWAHVGELRKGVAA